MAESSTPGLRFGLRARIMVATGTSVAVLALLLVSIFSFRMGNVLDEELVRRGGSVSMEMASSLAYAIFSEDKTSLAASAKDTLKDNPDAAYVLFRDAQGALLVDAFSERAKGMRAADVPASVVGEKERLTRKTVGGLDLVELEVPVFFRERAGAADPGLGLPGTETRAPQAASKRVGLVQLGLLREPLRAQVAHVRNEALAATAGLLLVILLIIYVIAGLISVPLETLSAVAGAIARGDLCQRVVIPDRRDEIADLAKSFGQMTRVLRNLVLDLRSATADLDRQAAEVLSTATAQATMANEQSASLSETSATVTEIAQTGAKASEHAEQVIQVTTRSEEVNLDGQRAVGQSISGIEQLGEQVAAIAQSITDLSERTLQIGDIISTVKEVAEQSNLLALNASIEAAKAGEHGRGFAVVALEMRNLAEQSRLAAGQVRTLLGEVNKGIRDAVAATEEGSKRASSTVSLSKAAGETIQSLAEVSRESAQAAKQIAANTRQQTIGVQQIVTATNELSGAMNDSVAGTQKIEQVAGALKTLSGRLNELVGRFQA